MPGHVVETVTVESRPTAVVAETTTWDAFPALWPQLLDEVYAVVRPRPELGLPDPSGERWRNVMLYRDDAPSVEIGVLVAAPFAAVGRVAPSVLPGGRIARTTHRGGYDGLGAAHDAVVRFAADQGLALAGPRWEIYGHATPDPDAIEIEICWLLA